MSPDLTMLGAGAAGAAIALLVRHLAFPMRGLRELAVPPPGAVNVADRGIPINGTTDAGPLLQSLFDTVPAGTTLWFPAGFYGIANVPIIRQSLTLLGEPSAARFVPLAGQSRALLQVNANHVHIEGLSFLCDNTVATGIDAFSTSPITDITICDVDVYQSILFGVHLGSSMRGSGRFAVINSHMMSCADPVAVEDYADDVLIRGNQILASTSPGVVIEAKLGASANASNVLIDGNVIESLDGIATTVIRNASDVSITRNLIIAWNALDGLNADLAGHTGLSMRANRIVQKSAVSGTVATVHAAQGIRFIANRIEGLEYGLGLGPKSTDAVIVGNTAVPTTVQGVFEIDPQTGDHLPLLPDQVLVYEDNRGLPQYQELAAQ